MESLKRVLAQYNLSYKQMDEFVDVYKMAIRDNIPFPFMFALTKVLM